MSVLRILHTSDLHLGAKFTFLGLKGKEHRRQLLATFSQIIDLAITAQVDLFIIAGDLFDSNNPSRQTVDAVLSGFRHLDNAGIDIVITPGTHERIGRDCIYLHEFWNDFSQLTIFGEGGWNSKKLKNIKTTVYGWGYDGRHPGDILKQLRLDPADDSHFRIGILHGSLLRRGMVEDDEVIFSQESLEQCGLDYLALGHWHSFLDCSQGKTKAFYPGPPEPIAVGDNGGKVILVTLSREDSSEIKPVQVGKRRFIRKVINMEMVSDSVQLKNMLKEWADLDCFLSVSLRGPTLFPDLIDLDELEEELSPLFFGIRISNESFPAPQFLDKFRSTGLVTSEFVRIAEEHIKNSSGEERLIAEEALRLGLAYLEGRIKN